MTKFHKLLSIIIFLFLSFNSFAYRIENNKLIIENGDNLWNISHNLLSKGIDYHLIWDINKGKYPQLTNDPSLIYDGMVFDIPGSLLHLVNNIDDCCLRDSVSKVIEHLSSIDTNVVLLIEEVKDSGKLERKDWTTLIFGVIITLVSGWVGWETFKRFFKNLFNKTIIRGK